MAKNPYEAQVSSTTFDLLDKHISHVKNLRDAAKRDIEIAARTMAVQTKKLDDYELELNKLEYDRNRLDPAKSVTDTWGVAPQFMPAPSAPPPPQQPDGPPSSYQPATPFAPVPTYPGEGFER